MSESLTPETRFSDRVEDYMRSRPGYPVEILDVLASLPDDFYPDGRHDSAAFEQREPFE